MFIVLELTDASGTEPIGPRMYNTTHIVWADQAVDEATADNVCRVCTTHDMRYVKIDWDELINILGEE